MEPKYTIYCHTHIESGRRYVGITKHTMMHRWNQHCTQAMRSKNGRWHFPNAIRKYGKIAFSHEVLEVCSTLEEANARENYWIEHLETRNPLKGFNLAKGGEHKPHPIRKNPWDDPEYRKKHASNGFKFTAESRARALETLRTVESKTKRSAISREVQSRPEVKAKARKAQLGKQISDAARAKISAWQKGHTVSEETRMKLRIGNLGKKRSLETRARMSAVRKGKPIPLSTKNKSLEKIRTFVIDADGRVVSKKCKTHGLLQPSQFIATKHSNGNHRVLCKLCWYAKAKERRRRLKA